jgi:hypothetical protein
VNRQKVEGRQQSSNTVDATLGSIVADGFLRVKLTAGNVSVMTSLTEGGNLNHEDGYGTQQQHVNHATFMKENG